MRDTSGGSEMRKKKSGNITNKKRKEKKKKRLDTPVERGRMRRLEARQRRWGWLHMGLPTTTLNGCGCLSGS